jgi:hypothetical protein
LLDQNFAADALDRASQLAVTAGPVAKWKKDQRLPFAPEHNQRCVKMVVRIAGERMYLWRAVNHEGEVLDMLVQRRRDTRAAQPLMRSCSKSKVSRRNCWSPTSCAPTPRRSGVYD